MDKTVLKLCRKIRQSFQHLPPYIRYCGYKIPCLQPNRQGRRLALGGSLVRVPIYSILLQLFQRFNLKYLDFYLSRIWGFRCAQSYLYSPEDIGWLFTITYQCCLHPSQGARMAYQYISYQKKSIYGSMVSQHQLPHFALLVQQAQSSSSKKCEREVQAVNAFKLAFVTALSRDACSFVCIPGVQSIHEMSARVMRAKFGRMSHQDRKAMHEKLLLAYNPPYSMLTFELDHREMHHRLQVDGQCAVQDQKERTWKDRILILEISS